MGTKLQENLMPVCFKKKDAKHDAVAFPISIVTIRQVSDQKYRGIENK